MNRTERRQLGRLPVTATPWEVLLWGAPVTIQGVHTEGLLLVVEQRSQLVRVAGPVVRGQPLLELLRMAFLTPPPPCSPARPPRLLCADPDLRRRLVTELAGTDVRVDAVAAVPAAEAAIGSLMESLEPAPAPGITTRLPAWAAAFEALVAVAPWARVPVGVTFRFHGEVPELADAVAVVFGPDVDVGLSLFATPDDHARFEAAMGSDDPEDLLAEVDVAHLYVEPVADRPQDEQDACAEAGLVTRSGLSPHLLAMREGLPAPVPGRMQDVVLAAVQAVTALVAAGLEPGRATVPTVLGAVEVRSTPAPKVSRALIHADHQAAPGQVVDPDDGRSRTALVVKLLKRDAERLAKDLVGVDRLEVVPLGSEARLVAWAGPDELGWLVQLPAADVATLEAAGRIVVCVAAGGARRTGIRPQDPLATFDVAVTGPPGAARPRHDAVFDGPTSGWPKASEVLLAFAEPLLDRGRLPLPLLEDVLRTATAVWGAVVMADLGGDGQALEEVGRAMATGPAEARAVVGALIERKRRLFAGDPRLFHLERVESRKTGPQVFVNSAVVAGVELGRGSPTR